MIPIYALVVGVELIQLQFELYHIYEVVETTLDKVDRVFYERMESKYGNRINGTSNYTLRILSCSRFDKPPKTNLDQ